VTGISPNRRLSPRNVAFIIAALLLASAALARPVRTQDATASSPSAPAAPAPAHSAPAIVPAAKPAPMFSGEARAAADSDAVLQGMVAEIERSKDHLKMEGVQTPYFIEYRVMDVNGDSVNAIFGATQSNQHTRARILRVVVRVGD
jgi:hypothetical protein